MILKKKEQIELIRKVIEIEENFINAIGKSDSKFKENPQIIDMVVRSDARAEAFEAVLDMLLGNNVAMKIFTDRKEK